MPPVTTRSDAERRRRPAQVAEEIKRWIVAENIAPGTRLPREAELMDRFGMAKGTIREAMRLLEAEGLLTSRPGPGGGSFVHAPSGERAAALLGNYFYFQRLTVADIYQVRQALEPELAATLAGRLSPAQIAALEANIADYDSPPRDAEEERDQHVASLRFHRLLAGYGENPLLGFLIDFMASMLANLTVTRRLYEPRNFDLWRSGRDYQRDLVAALRRGDGAAARRIMTAHMATAQALMQAQEAEMARRFLGTA